jgi:hypothetical protein
MLKHILSALCTKENVAMAVLAVAGIAVAVSSTKEAAPAESAEPEFDFDRDVYRNPEYFKEVMEDIGIWEPEEKM